MTEKADTRVLDLLQKHKVVPDVIDNGPNALVEVMYEKSGCLQIGGKLTPEATQKPPNVNWKVEPGAFYTLIMTDPDAPSRERPRMREWHHWLVVNIPGMEVYKGDVITEYVGPSPPKGSGLHRYVYLVYKQPNGKIKCDEPKLTSKMMDNRGKFSAKNFAAKYDLGIPIAGNMFQAENK